MGSSASASASASASVAVHPRSRASRHRGPYADSLIAWDATTPTPGRTHGTTAPAANIAVCRATPSWPVSASRATIDNVTRPAWLWPRDACQT